MREFTPGQTIWLARKNVETGWFKLTKEIVKDPTDQDYLEMAEGNLVRKNSPNIYLNKQEAIKDGKAFLKEWIRHLECQINEKETELGNLNDSLKDAIRQFDALLLC